MVSSLANVDAALLALRRLWAPTTSGRAARGTDAGIDLSTVLIVHAISTAGSGMSVAEIANVLGVAAATASRLCDRAVSGGYVTKSASAADARRLSLALTSKGAELHGRSEEFRLDYLARIFQDWSSSDLDSFQHLLSRFATAVQSDPPAPPRGDAP